MVVLQWSQIPGSKLAVGSSPVRIHEGNTEIPALPAGITTARAAASGDCPSHGEKGLLAWVPPEVDGVTPKVWWLWRGSGILTRLPRC